MIWRAQYDKRKIWTWWEILTKDEQFLNTFSNLWTSEQTVVHAETLLLKIKNRKAIRNVSLRQLIVKIGLRWPRNFFFFFNYVNLNFKGHQEIINYNLPRMFNPLGCKSWQISVAYPKIFRDEKHLYKYLVIRLPDTTSVSLFLLGNSWSVPRVVIRFNSLISNSQIFPFKYPLISSALTPFYWSHGAH